MIKTLYALAALAWILLLLPYPATVFIAACFACFSYPFYKRLCMRWPGLRAIIAYSVSLVILLVVPIMLFISLVAPQARAGFFMLRRLRADNFQLPQTWLDGISTIQEWLSFVPGLDLMPNIGESIESTLGEAVSMIVSGGFGFLGGTMTVFWTLFLFITLSVLCVAYAERFRHMLLVTTKIRVDMLNRFVQAIRAALRGVFMGILLVAVAQGILCGIGFSVAGIQQPAFWGLLATCVAPIPFIGTAIVWVPLCIFLWFSGKMGAAIGLAVWGMIAVAGIDNVLRPLFLQRGIHAPLFVLVLAILCGLASFGPTGLVVGPVLVAFAIQAIREADKLLGYQEVAPCSESQDVVNTPPPGNVPVTEPEI